MDIWEKNFESVYEVEIIILRIELCKWAGFPGM